MQGKYGIIYCHPYEEVAGICHKVKDGLATDYDIMEIAYQIDAKLPNDAVLIPIPGHNGKAEITLKICQYTQRPYFDLLSMRPTKTTWYERKRDQWPVIARKNLPHIFRKKKWSRSKLPPLNYVLIDLVAATGETIRKARNALGYGAAAYVFAYDESEPEFKVY